MRLLSFLLLLSLLLPVIYMKVSKKPMPMMTRIQKRPGKLTALPRAPATVSQTKPTAQRKVPVVAVKAKTRPKKLEWLAGGRERQANLWAELVAKKPLSGK
ncbi:unnamed protein product, partial [Mesorhabditis belari]|uniref:Uncharacterized protein n=1 Tax=Mesorhabditis belari TaxID=2138241 RepID=A0AAF3FJE7_9BILA